MASRGGLVRLVALVLRELPGLSQNQAHSLLREVRERNGGRLLGLRMKRFRRLVNKINRER